MRRINRLLLAALPALAACTSLVGLEELPEPTGASGSGGAATAGAQPSGGVLSAGAVSSGGTGSMTEAGTTAGGAAGQAGEAGSGGSASLCPVDCAEGAECSDGKCMCPANQAVCQDECVDLSMDRDNCGTCGETCPDECSAARCVQRVFKSMTAALGHFITFADPTIDDYLYFTDRDAGEVVRVSKNGGTPLILASELSSPIGIARTGSYVVWGNQTAGTIMRAAADGSSAPIVLAANAGYPQAVAATASHVYWTDFRAETGSVYRAPLAGGGTFELVATQLDNVYDLEIDASYAYVTVLGGVDDGGSIVRAPLSGGTPTLLLDVQPAGPLLLTPQGSITYLAEESVFVVGRNPGAPPPQEILAVRPAQLAADASFGYGVFYTDESSFVSRFPLTGGGELQPLAEVRDPGVSVIGLVAQNVAVDATRVYYSDTHGVIRSTSKIP